MAKDKKPRKKVRALSRMAGKIVANPGDVLVLSADDAEPLLAGGYAEEVEEGEKGGAGEGENEEHSTGGDDADGADVGHGARGRAAQPRRSKKTG